MDLSRTVPLFNFAYHHGDWLNDIAKVAKDEPWGDDNKVLELCLRANFEIASSQGKVYKDDETAFWKAGFLVNLSSDPLWLVYRKNNRDRPIWSFDKVTTGEPPCDDVSKWSYKYELPEFYSSWKLQFNQWNINHIMGDSHNKKRLENVFDDCLGGKYNEHLIFRAIYGELELKRKEEAVIPQWYRNEYQFLMPLYLTQSDKPELTAVLHPNSSVRSYTVRTLLLPHFAYAYARSVVKNRSQFADWIKLSSNELKLIEEVNEDID